MEFHDDMTHLGRVVSGLESLHEHINYNAGIDVDGTYALTVLELHAADEGEVAGTEGFLDAVKKGANDVVAWIMKIVKAIVDFITGKKKVVWKDRWKDINDEEVNKKLNGIYSGPLRAIVNHISDDKFEAVSPYHKFMDLDQINDKAKSILDELEKTGSLNSSYVFKSITVLSKDILDEMENVKKAIEKLDAKQPGVGVAVNKLTALAGALGKASEVLDTAWKKHYDALVDADRETNRRDLAERQEAEKDKK